MYCIWSGKTLMEKMESVPSDQNLGALHSKDWDVERNLIKGERCHCSMTLSNSLNTCLGKRKFMVRFLSVTKTRRSLDKSSILPTSSFPKKWLTEIVVKSALSKKF